MIASVMPDIVRAETPEKAWDQLDGLGLSRLTGPPASGGSGASWVDAAALHRAAAAHAVALPLVEHDLVATWVLDQAGLSPAGGVRSYAELDERGTARDVGWASSATSVVAVYRRDGNWCVADVPVGDVRSTPGVNVAGHPRDDVAIDVASLEGVPVSPEVVREAHHRGALARAVQISGALSAIVATVLEHVAVRTQFGRPLQAFQAVQQTTADIAGEAALATAATDAAVAHLMTSDDHVCELAVAVARSCAGHATTVVTRGAHQLLGALGTTSEHALHSLTLPATAWRSEFGSTASWDRQVARSTSEANSVWSALTR